MKAAEILKLGFPWTMAEIVETAEFTDVRRVLGAEAILEMAKSSKVSIRQTFKKALSYSRISVDLPTPPFDIAELGGSKYWIGLLDGTGGRGFDGAGKVERIVGVFKRDGEFDIFVGAIEITGTYSSYDGFIWDEQFVEVSAHPELVIDWY